jgi:hypothetical protein
VVGWSGGWCFCGWWLAVGGEMLVVGSWWLVVSVCRLRAVAADGRQTGRWADE